MKRQSGRDTGRRVRGSPDMLRPGSRERMSPGNDRYEGRGGSKLGRSSRSMEKDDRRDRDGGRRSGNMRGRGGRGGGGGMDDRNYGGDYRGGYDRYDSNKTYTSLRLTGFPSHVADMAIKDALYHEFKKFGDVNIRITYSGPNEERTAFANFRAHEHARDAKMAKGDRITLFAKSLRVDCVFKPKNSMKNQQRRSQSPDMGYGGRMGPSNMGGGRRQQGGMQKGMGRDNPGRERNFYGNDRRPYGNENYNNREHDRERELMLLPEDDPKATRTVFVGNLEDGISENEIKRSFERYGIIEDIDIKYPPRNQGNPFAFVRYLNLDMAHKAMVSMSGQYIGRNQCKTGYGKLSPTSRLWVGGLGPWVSLGVLEREFDRFGAIRKIDYVKGEPFAYVQYETLDAAQVAANNMRGFPLGGPDRRLRVDFAEPDSPNKSPYGAGSGGYQQGGRRNDQGGGNFDRDFGGGRSPPAQYRDQWAGDNGGEQRRGGGGEWQGGNGRYQEDWNRRNNSRDRNSGGPERRGKRGGSPGSDYNNDRTPDRTRPFKRRRSPSANQDRARSDRSFESPEHGSLGNRDSSPDYRKRHRSSSEDGNDGEFDQRRRFQKGEGRKDSLLHGAETLSDLVKHLDLAWQGYVVLKNSAFATRMFLIGGDTSLADSLLPHGKFDDDGILRITQRLRLDQPKLEEVGKRISGAGSSGHCLLLALPGDDMSDPAPIGTQSRALRNLVSYLQQKQAAGVISLPVAGPKDTDAGVLHAFPPCEFSQKHLLNYASGLGLEPSKEDHLVVIVVRGAAFTTSG